MVVQNSLGLIFATLLSSSIRGRGVLRTIIFTPTTLSVLVIGFANAPHRKLVLSDCGRAERLATEHRPVGRKARRDAR
jgi:hypothetical protein